MARTDDDTWSITESVGATALFVATARAFEARKADPLAIDPFAELLVSAAGGKWAAALRGEGPVFDTLGTGWFGTCFQRYQGARTRFFDEVFAEAAASGVRQYVIPAAGLDARAYRLGYPEGSRVFELDQPQVLDFKTQTLTGIGASPAAGRVIVPIDLRQDWPTALVNVGFAPTKPSAWILEGLLMYLSAEAETLLLERLLSLSAPGSWVGIEHMQPLDMDKIQQGMRLSAPELSDDSAASSSHFTELIYNEPRTDVVEWLTDKGWAAQDVPSSEHMAQLGHPIDPPIPGQAVPATTFMTTTLVAATLQP
jgi:methyltransferase (TIGR00027 family)